MCQWNLFLNPGVDIEHMLGDFFLSGEGEGFLHMPACLAGKKGQSTLKYGDIGQEIQ